MSASCAHCFEDFSGNRVNSSSIIAEEWGSLLCKTFQTVAHHALRHLVQIFHECMQLLIVLEVLLQIHADTIFLLRISSNFHYYYKIIFRCSNNDRSVLPPLSFTVAPFDKVALAFM
jgi:hypothetical protein